LVVPSSSSSPANRRDFLKTSTLAAAGTALSIGAHAYAAESTVLKVGLIGCGGRGSGAAAQCVNAGENIKLVAMADMFQDHLDDKKVRLKKELGDKFAVTDQTCFVGFDGYKELLKTDVDLVILATPPHFRPLHLEAAVKANKHIFAEKPVAVDAPGVRRVLASVAEAKQKNLALVSGLCWRYDPPKREVMKRIHDGAVGDIVTLQCNYNTHFLWSFPRQDKWSDMEWQLRNWLYFTWLSGDHNVEQHIHSLDKMMWAMKDVPPVKAYGVGGRQSRTSEAFGNIFDHHSVVYQWENGVKCFAMTRQQDGCPVDVNDYIMGTKGTCDVMKHTISGATPWKHPPLKPEQRVDMYQQEHIELVESIRSGKPRNDGDYMTKSTMMAIMGRMATYTGQTITWEMAMNSKEDLSPPKYEFGPLPVATIAKPGVTPFV
jgi:myo-inositol 2-dehydrogenase/D-chiro-inositol 1-dehydrogenase